MATGLSQPAQQNTDGVTDAKVVMTAKLFTGAIIGILRSEGIIRPDADGTHPAVQDSIDKWFAATGADWQTVSIAVADAVVSFEEWLLTGAYTYTEPVLYTVSNLTVTATMRTQSGEISVGMQIYPMEGIPLSDVIRSAKGELQNAIEGAFSKGQPSPLPETTQQTQKSEFTSIKSIRYENVDGNLRVRMMPASGRWVKFGIAVYDDKVKEFGLQAMMPGEYPAQGDIEYTVKPDGKPDRVIAYRR